MTRRPNLRPLLVGLSILWMLPGAARAGDDPAGVDTTLRIERVLVTRPVKQTRNLREQPMASTQVAMREMEERRVLSIKELSALAPNVHIPEYGSRMTSSIYVRGMGARIDQPVVGLYVDQVPYLNKNDYDFDWQDIQRIEMLRGPQSTLYGRNTLGGIVNVQTLSPFVWEGSRLGVEYGSRNTMRVRASTYHRSGEQLGLSAAAWYGRSDGFYRNHTTDRLCDGYDEGGARMRVQWLSKGGWSVDNTLSAGVVRQGGYAYAYVDPVKGPQPVAYNDPTGYDRFHLVEGLTVRRTGERVLWQGVVSYQYTDDEMRLDQDFLPASYFTLRQAQHEHAATAELTLRRADAGARWQWITGAFGFLRRMHMEAPVNFKRDGIDELILGGANSGLQHVFPDARIAIDEEEFPILSRFGNPSWGAALYHQSTLRLGRWELTAGLRFDVERSVLRYDSRTLVHYNFSLAGTASRPLDVELSGRERTTFTEWLPRVAVQYRMRHGSLYASVAKGYKAGGFNTQIFSDLVQNRMMGAMMRDIGVHIDGVGDASYDAASAMRYRPEYSWNYEAGFHFDLAGGRVESDAALFYIDCRDQQLTVFPGGKNTGRMMRNAGRTRSYGAEAALRYRSRQLRLQASYGYTNARFLRFNDGKADYRHRTIPYAPRHTVALAAAWDIPVHGRLADRFTLHAEGQGIGPIVWNEANTLRQPFYGLLSAGIGLHKGGFALEVWGRNLTATDYHTFYFVSIGNAFLQRGKPRVWGVSLSMDF